MKVVIALIVLFTSASKADFKYYPDVEGPKKGIYTITIWAHNKPYVFKVDQKLYESNQDAMVREIAAKVKQQENE